MLNNENSVGAIDDKSTNDEARVTSSPNNGNTHVGCSLSGVSTEATSNKRTFKEVLEAVSTMEDSFNSELFNILSSCEEKVIIVIATKEGSLHHKDYYRQPVKVVVYKDGEHSHCHFTYGG